jgi:hypothetical protein
MSLLKYISVDRVFSKLNRDLKGTELNESDVIEWIGEALEFLAVPQVLVEDVKFLKVVDFHTEFPENLHMVTQIAKHNENYSASGVSEIFCEENKLEKQVSDCEKASEEVNVSDFNTISDESGYLENMPDAYAAAFLNAEKLQDMNPLSLNKLDLDWTYTVWASSDYYQNNFSPVRLTTNTFFNSIVCKERDMSIYNNCGNEYTIIGEIEKKFRFNFRDGTVAVSYLKNSVDNETGYPLIPDNISYISAITYYIKWKLAEMYDWSGREGYVAKADKAEERWLKYARQAKNNMKMPKTLDEHQNLLEQTHYLIPDHKKYYGFFGNLGKSRRMNFQNLNTTYNS